MDNQKATPIKRGVSLYSFQEEYFLRKMSLEDIIATTQKLDIPGVEIIPDQMIPGYPNISAEFLKQWHGWMEKYGRTPVCMDMFLDWNKFKGRVMTEDERVESITLDIVNANKLGCGVIRVIHDVEPAILERLAPTAEKYGVKLALEIHAPSYYDSELEQRLIAMFERVQSPYLCFTLDLGVFVKRLPRVITERFLRDGMKKELVEYDRRSLRERQPAPERRARRPRGADRQDRRHGRHRGRHLPSHDGRPHDLPGSSHHARVPAVHLAHPRQVLRDAARTTPSTASRMRRSSRC